jgi:hypothetical protein
MEFHAYVSVLIPCNRHPRVKDSPHQKIQRAVYIDGPLNFIELRKKRQSLTLRVLIPFADTVVTEGWSDEMILRFCRFFLDSLLANGCLDYTHASVHRWKYGLPCRKYSDQTDQYIHSGGRIFFAGDRFAKWPSMAGAIVSGSRAAEALIESQSL